MIDVDETGCIYCPHCEKKIEVEAALSRLTSQSNVLRGLVSAMQRLSRTNHDDGYRRFDDADRALALFVHDLGFDALSRSYLALKKVDADEFFRDALKS